MVDDFFFFFPFPLAPQFKVNKNIMTIWKKKKVLSIIWIGFQKYFILNFLTYIHGIFKYSFLLL